MKRHPISPSTWRLLVDANQRAANDGWATRGVFATAVGPRYERAGPSSLLYVGKSRGPAGTRAKSSYDQAANAEASTDWMITRQNKSAFWQFVEAIDQSRELISWTNVCKMDLSDESGKPPRGRHWTQIRNVSQAALEEEISGLSPRVVVFVTGSNYRLDVWNVVQKLGYMQKHLAWDDGRTVLFAKGDIRFAIQTRHPQGWSLKERNRVVDLIKSCLSVES